MKHAIVKSGPDWAALNEQWTRSGLSMKEFCRRQDIPYKGFLKGRRGDTQVVAAAGHSQSDLAQLIPVNLAPARPTPEIVVELPMGVTIRFRGMQTS